MPLPKKPPPLFPPKNKASSKNKSFYKKTVVLPPSTNPPIIRINNGTFFRHHPDSILGERTINSPMFEDLNFSLHSGANSNGRLKHWAVIGPSLSGKTSFLNVLRGRFVGVPRDARSFPFLEVGGGDDGEGRSRFREPEKAIRIVGFDGEQGIGGNGVQSAYLSARYESRREAGDWTVMDYLLGNTEFNPSEEEKEGRKPSEKGILARVVKDLRLTELVGMPVGNLSNGQTRRARIARALMEEPEVLLLDEPFMGLDPATLLTLSPMLKGLAEKQNPRLVLGLRPQDPVPEWISHIVYLRGNCEVKFMGAKGVVWDEIGKYVQRVYDGIDEEDPSIPLHTYREIGKRLVPKGILDHFVLPRGEEKRRKKDTMRLTRDGYPAHDLKKTWKESTTRKPIVEMNGVTVKYGDKAVLGDWKQIVPWSLEKQNGLWWSVHEGQRWGIFGPNGSGKTTLLSLICSDHPQTYSLPIKLFGRSRIPEPGQPGISIFDLQSRIGHSSPEIHSHMPKSLTLRQVLENAWADTFRGIPKLDDIANQKIDAVLKWFEKELRPLTDIKTENEGLEWATQHLFGELPFSAQKVALFLRAIIKSPDLVILDEAFGGMDEKVRDRCMLFLAHGEHKISLEGPTEYVLDEKSKQVEVSRIVNSVQHIRMEAKFDGLTEKQALLCVSHVREEVPGCVRQWIRLPEPGEGSPARFGKLGGPIEGDPEERWGGIWGLNGVKEELKKSEAGGERELEL